MDEMLNLSDEVLAMKLEAVIDLISLCKELKSVSGFDKYLFFARLSKFAFSLRGKENFAKLDSFLKFKREKPDDFERLFCVLEEINERAKNDAKLKERVERILG